MRPLRLELRGFTAFREPEELDFRALDLFAISGPTGSGKSSLLDAMTYALYGRVERVGDGVRQLISQGQPRMAVSLEFEVGTERYKVTRSTPAGRGATKIQLMRWDGDDWVQAGEGSDRVRDVESRLQDAIGLSYDGFTRSVLLPQGRFAEFMVGDARKRREILTELLGHALFKRMAERAGSAAREASVRADTLGGVLAQEYAGVSAETLSEAEAAARDAARREADLGAAADAVIAILSRWQEAERTLPELQACAAEARRQGADVEAAWQELETLRGALDEATATGADREVRSAAAREALDAAQAAVQALDARVGPARELARAHAWAEALDGATRALGRAAEARAQVVEAASGLESALVEALAVRVEHERELAASEEALRLAEAALEVARHDDLVGALASGLRAGDPCPVCGLPLAAPPSVPESGAVAEAQAGFESARARDAETRAGVRDDERAVDTARLAVEANAAERDRLAADTEAREREVAEQGARLESLLGAPLPTDPATEIERRLAERSRVEGQERDAERALSDAERAVVEAERHLADVTAGLERQRDRLAADRQPLFDRAAAALGKRGSTLPAPPDPEDAPGLGRYASKLAGLLRALGERLAAEMEERMSLERRLLEEATEVVDGLVAPAPSLEALAASVNAACRTATADAATAAQRAEGLRTRLAAKQGFEREAAELQDRSRVFKALAQELRQDRLIAYLQAEALQLLAAAGSERLATLSEGRYRLRCEEDEFAVVDTWNGDEERSVRTLSGGETFLASLSLALALADQVRSLSVTDRSRLDSLFLDEGFGTLDPETLRTVTDAIEQLAGDGRLVGVITHVKELADQFPRVEVTKSPSGSRLQLVP